MKLKPADYFIFFIVVILIVFSFRLVKNISTDYVEITTPYKRLIFPLKKDKVFTVKGKIGFLKIQIKNREVRVLEADCPNKICVKTGWIKNGNEYIACVPNGILIKLISGKSEKKSYDFITK